jgi:pyruvate kinase
MITNIRSAALKEGKDVAIMIDLKGPLIRTLGFRDTMYSIQVKTGEEVHISTNKKLKGEPGMFGIDYDRIHEKLMIGDKVLVDYGGVVLTVIGFEYEKTYLANQARKRRLNDLKSQLEDNFIPQS